MVMVIVIVINGDRDGVGEGDVMIVSIIITAVIFGHCHQPGA